MDLNRKFKQQLYLVNEEVGTVIDLREQAAIPGTYRAFEFFAPSPTSVFKPNEFLTRDTLLSRDETDGDTTETHASFTQHQKYVLRCLSQCASFEDACAMWKEQFHHAGVTHKESAKPDSDASKSSSHDTKSKSRIASTSRVSREQHAHETAHEAANAYHTAALLNVLVKQLVSRNGTRVNVDSKEACSFVRSEIQFFHQRGHDITNGVVWSLL
ncbi:MAG: hypothetical protein MHM6MM_001531 [Cercozoa sp. M6MM]